MINLGEGGTNGVCVRMGDKKKTILNSLEIVVYSALNSVGLKSKVNISSPPKVDVVLVEDIIQTLIQVLQVE